MTERPDQPGDTPDFLAKPTPPSGEHPADPTVPPTYGAPGNAYVTGPEPTAPYGTPPPPPGQPGHAPYAPYQPYPQHPYAPSPGMPGYPFAQAHQGANVAMGLGIASLVCAVATPFCCITIPGVLAGPFAIVLAARARTQIKQSPGLYNNEGSATAGLVTGIIGTVLGLAMVALVVFFFGFVFAVGDNGY